MGSAVIRSLPPREPKPGENPLRTKLIDMLMSEGLTHKEAWSFFAVLTRTVDIGE